MSSRAYSLFRIFSYPASSNRRLSQSSKIYTDSISCLIIWNSESRWYKQQLSTRSQDRSGSLFRTHQQRLSALHIRYIEAMVRHIDESRAPFGTFDSPNDYKYVSTLSSWREWILRIMENLHMNTGCFQELLQIPPNSNYQ